MIIGDFLRNVNMSVGDMAEKLGYTYTHTYNVLKGFSPVTEAFLWRFYATFVDQQAPFYLPEASSALRELRKRDTQ